MANVKNAGVAVNSDIKVNASPTPTAKPPTQSTQTQPSPPKGKGKQTDSGKPDQSSSRQVIEDINNTYTPPQLPNDLQSGGLSVTGITGLPTDEPTVVLFSEYQPLYSDVGSLTQVGESIKLKCDAKLHTAMTAMTAMVTGSIDSSLGPGAEPSVISAVRSNIEDLRSYMKDNDATLSDFLSSRIELQNSMNVYRYFSSTDSFNSVRSSISSVNPQSDLKKYTQTKIWQLALLNFKRSVYANSEGFFGSANPTSVTGDNDENDLTRYLQSSTSRQHYWLNPYSEPITLENLRDASKSLASVDKIVSFDEQLFVNLDANNSNPKTSNASSLLTFDGTGNDIARIASTILKEIQYSSAIKLFSSELSTKYGYTVSNGGNNLVVWDYVIGRFSKSAIDVPSNPAGNGNSLVSFSNVVETQGSTSYNVLAFENHYFKEGSPPKYKNVTPGSSYYIDSCLSYDFSTRRFDTSRLDKLKTKALDASSTAQLVRNFLASNDAADDGDPRKNFTFEKICNSLNKVTKVYAKRITFNLKDNSISLNYPEFLGGNKITGEELSTRVTAGILKTCVKPTVNYAGLYKLLKAYLFILAMQEVFDANENVTSDDATVIKAAIKQLILKATLLRNQTILSAKERDHIAGLVPDTFVVLSDMQEFLNPKKGLWADVISLMRSLYELDEIYSFPAGNTRTIYSTTSKYPQSTTNYSGVSRVVMLYAFFDLIARIVASQIPEELIPYKWPGLSSSTNNTPKNVKPRDNNDGDGGDPKDPNDQKDPKEPSTKTPQPESGLYFPKQDKIPTLYQDTTKAILQFGLYKLGGADIDVSTLVSSLNSARSRLQVERQYTQATCDNFTNFLNGIVEKVNTHKDKISNVENSNLPDLYANDPSLTPITSTRDNRGKIFASSLSSDQIVMSKYIMSEYADRISSMTVVGSLWNKFPELAEDSANFPKLFNTNDTELVTHRILSKYFRLSDFSQVKGQNKKMLTVAIPSNMLKSRRADDNLTPKDSLVSLKVYRSDRLRPDIVFEPITFNFDLSRYPTRVLSNWGADALDSNLYADLRKIPFKVYTTEGVFETRRNFDDAKGRDSFSSISESESDRIHRNHAISFLIEEYLRWFTDCSFDETRYHNWGALTSVSQIQEDQTTTAGEFITANFTIPIDNTIKSYLRNETFLLSPEVYKRRISYPKKFDRVFHVIIDPDDFVVSTTWSDSDTLNSLKNKGLIVNNRQRQRSNDDISFDEYFVTAESTY